MFGDMFEKVPYEDSSTGDKILFILVMDNTNVLGVGTPEHCLQMGTTIIHELEKTALEDNEKSGDLEGAGESMQSAGEAVEQLEEHQACSFSLNGTATCLAINPVRILSDENIQRTKDA